MIQNELTLVARIRSDILAGVYPPGSDLLQTELAATYGVSRIPVRDALQSLAAQRLVDLVPGRGAQVVALTQADLAEIRDLRLMLECDLLARAIGRADQSAMDDVDFAMKVVAAAIGRTGGQEADWAFHDALYRAADCPRQLAIVQELRPICALYLREYDSKTANTTRWLREHQALADAFRGRRAEEAKSVLRQHIRATHAQMDAVAAAA